MRAYVLSGLLKWGWIILTAGSKALWAQVSFDSDDPQYFQKYGLPYQKVHTKLSEALRRPGEVVKLKLKDEYIPDKVSRLSRLVNLQILDLDNVFLEELPEALGHMPQLLILVSRRNRIKKINPGLARAGSLMYMELYGTALDSLPSSLSRLTRLELLRVGPNYADTLRLSPQLARLHSMRDLQFLDCNLYQFPEWITALPRLERLVLIRCQLDTVNVSLKHMSHLKAIDLSGNRFRVLPRPLLDVPNLEYLGLRDNQLVELPEHLLFLRKLQTLDVRGNPIRPDNLRLLRLALPRCRILWEPPGASR
ncbi:MAG: leucine-rich repeat domain-containing protein [Flavobacteriales bacterium]|nr:leucine-rich repeat domain-containing protein [Flavobacteriales bacterium]MCX7768557.1 leucine-rich repeat domain-containing protein [Flavobacteriales bacterium]MDW8409474.1 leucine-rich repeat domain-containing protein [Flavobacteriales bacterium]